MPTTNLSPWIAQLTVDRVINPLNENRKTDVAIVGAGIAGVSTAYFTLKNTDKNIILIEADKVAHGATGHNAGQLVSYFERQIADLVKEYGLKQTAEAQAAVDSAWGLLEKIYKDAKLQTPFAQFTGYAGCQNLEEVMVHLENNLYAKTLKINIEPLMIAEESEVARQIPEKFKDHYSLLPHKNILELLETNDEKYIAVLSARKGVMNSALFCEELLEHLFRKYPHRFTLVERSPVTEVCLNENSAVLKIRACEVTAEKVVLCTNGFEKFKITNLVGDDIDTNFHHMVKGCIGYMSAFLEDHDKSPIAISYLQSDATPYFYLTRRTFEIEANQKHSLICIGGPELVVEDSTVYTKDHVYPEETHKNMDTFLHKTYKFAPEGDIKYEYRWHGLMGYTPNGVRCIGPEPINPVLMYNLGCNGVGILPSIYAGKKIAQMLKGEKLEKSIFDPKDSRTKPLRNEK